jgi:uncharacterized protein YdaT
LTNSAKNLANSAADKAKDTSKNLGKKAVDALLSEKTQQFMNSLREANEHNEKAHRDLYEYHYRARRNRSHFR